MSVTTAIRAAEKLLPGNAAPEGELDPRWQAIIEIAEFIRTSRDEVWNFTARWGCSDDPDLQSAVATCLLEHLLEEHFEALFPRVEELATASPQFAVTLRQCWHSGKALLPRNKAKLNSLLEQVRA